MNENATKTYGPIGESSISTTDAALLGESVLVTAGGLFGLLPFEGVVMILLATIAVLQV